MYIGIYSLAIAGEQQCSKYPQHTYRDRHVNHMRMQIGKEEAPKRKLVDGEGNDTATLPVVKCCYRHKSEKSEKLSFELYQAVEVSNEYSKKTTQQGNRTALRQCIDNSYCPTQCHGKKRRNGEIKSSSRHNT